MKKVPNTYPTLSFNGIAIIGEAPGATEAEFGRPFIGAAGQLLDSLLASTDIQRGACFIGNVCQYPPPSNQISRFSKDGPEITSSLAQLKEDLTTLKPNICVLLGDTALKAAGETRKLTDVLNGLFTCRELDSPFFGRKCIPTYHPAAIKRQWSWWPYLQFALQKALYESDNPSLDLPIRNLFLNLTTEQISLRLDQIQKDRLPIALDIEGGGPEGVRCMSIATSAADVFLINPYDLGDGFYRLLPQLADVLGDPNVPKILQNALYDNFCLNWHWSCPIRGVAWDTMLSGWERYPELRKGLASLVAIDTKEPPYKFTRKTDDIRIFHEYNCKDSAVTFEIADHHANGAISGYTSSVRPYAPDPLTETQRQHFEFNMRLLPPVAYMTRKGIRYDYAKAQERLASIRSEQKELSVIMETIIGQPLNCNSPKQKADILYTKLGFEKQFQIEKGRKTNKVSTDRKALLKLDRNFDHPLPGKILKWLQLDGVAKQLAYRPCKEGRIRAFYNLVGTETGRFSCAMKENEKAESVTLPGGAPLHVITKKNRDLYIADEGYWFFQCDLEGADGWTVAAHCAKHGDPTMLEDYQHSPMIKPARFLAAQFLYQQNEIDTNPSAISRSDLTTLLATIEIPDWLYFAAKRVQHATNYLVKPRTGVAQIAEDSYKLYGTQILVTERDFARLQRLYLNRYPGVQSWQRWVEQTIRNYPQLGSASGHIRTFFGRRGDHDTIKEAVAHEPQANTTYATNCVLYNLWNDPGNRIQTIGQGAELKLPPGHPIIQPLHQVHDAIIGQFPKVLTAWACDKIRQYFQVPLTIAGQKIIIPFEGAYGPSWGELTEGTI